jgi:hypothetical protein
VKNGGGIYPVVRVALSASCAGLTRATNEKSLSLKRMIDFTGPAMTAVEAGPAAAIA